MTVDAETRAFPSSGGSGTLVISTNRECGWSARSEAAWLTLSSGEGQGAGSVQFGVAANAESSPRTARITVNDQPLQIAQEGKPCEFTLSSNHENVAAGGGDGTLDVRPTGAQCAWTAMSNVSWITIVSGRDGIGVGHVAYHVEPFTGPARTGALTVAGQTVQIDQGAGCTYSVAPGTTTVGAAGGDVQIAVSAGSGCPWTAASNTAWITLTAGATGTGEGTVGFHVGATGGPVRTGTAIAAGRTITIVQAAGCAVSVNPAKLTASTTGGVATIQVDSAAGCAWSAATGAAWITLLPPASGAGAGQLQVAVAANPGPARNGTITVGGQNVAVAQASGCTYSLSPGTQQVAASGGPASASVVTVDGCTWNATSTVPWITPAATQGSGPGQVTFTVAPNDGPPRSAAVTVAGQLQTITQASSCTWSFSPPSHELGAAGGQGNVLVLVSGPCTWTAVSAVEWIRVIAGASGTGGGLVQFLVAPNSGPPRTGAITIAGQNYLVKQGGA